MNTEICYTVEKDGSIPGYGRTVVVTTEKAYWDRNHFVDDGSAPSYTAMSHAMEASGAEETEDSTFELMPGVTARQLVRNMAARGFTLVEDPAFTAFVRTHV